MPILFFSDILRKVGLEPAKVKLIRHVMTDKRFKACYDAGKVYEYTCHQKRDFSKGYAYWVTFISDGGTLCRLNHCYRVVSSVIDTPDIVPYGLPEIEAKTFQGEKSYYNLEEINILQEYEDRLIIDWGKSARMWHQKGSTEKAVIAIHGDVFPGFEQLCLSYDHLKKIIENPHGYENWYTALSSVNAIYLIADTKTGTQYVGSAYNNNGLWGRWASYIDTGGHGGNKKMMAVLHENPDRRHNLQFSVLQILPKTMTSNEIIRAESLWKSKLLTREFGWNEN